MRPENASMKTFLAANGIYCAVKYIDDGSLKGNWRLYGKGQTWNLTLQVSLTALGFVDFDGKPLNQYSGNGGQFSVFVSVMAETRAHEAQIAAIKGTGFRTAIS